MWPWLVRWADVIVGSAVIVTVLLVYWLGGRPTRPWRSRHTRWDRPL